MNEINSALEYFKKRDLANASERFLLAKEKLQPGERLLGFVYGWLGLTSELRLNYDEGLRNYQQAFNVYSKLGDWRGQSDILSNMGSCFQSLGRFKDAIQCHAQHAQIAKHLRDDLAHLRAQYNLAATQLESGNLEEAHKLAGQCLEIANRLSNKLFMGLVCEVLGLCVTRKTDPRVDLSEGIALLEKAHKFHVEAVDQTGAFRCLGHLAYAYASHQIFSAKDKAKDYCAQQLQMAIALRDERLEASAHSNTGYVSSQYNDFATALEHHKKHMELARKLQDRTEVLTALSNIGTSQLGLRRLVEAEDTFQRLLAEAQLPTPISKFIQAAEDGLKSLSKLKQPSR